MAIDDELPRTPTPHGGGGQSMSQAPPADPLFLAGTPSTQAGTPLRGVVARRAVGMHSTPRRSGQPLFAREYILYILVGILLDSCINPRVYQLVHHPALHTSLHLRLPKNAYRISGGREGSSRASSNLDSEPLEFPS